MTNFDYNEVDYTGGKIEPTVMYGTILAVITLILIALIIMMIDAEVSLVYISIFSVGMLASAAGSYFYYKKT